ncbi:MAG: competence/damage-inducible protein A [Alphaproteobacteria bacterium]|jgi:molybdenum cofactor synthesis domain-containing protein|nr:competence/damage-inducible protein A [Alphaproteobacteria bacterium]
MVSTAGIIIIGDEILSGRTKDTNINWIANELNKIGIRLIEARIIPDDPTTIIETIKFFTKNFTYVFSCGGIGPTHDDITTECVARAFNQELVKSDEAMRRLAAHYEGTNIEFNEARQKMAVVPSNSILIDNPVSAAPGYKIENLFVFAGVPKIMQGMFHTILHDLLGGIKLLSKTVSSNLGEGLIAKDLEKIESEFEDVKIGSYPYFKPGNFGTSVVLRSENKDRLNEASKKVLLSIINHGGKGKILEENEIDDRSL